MPETTGSSGADDAGERVGGQRDAAAAAALAPKAGTPAAHRPTPEAWCRAYEAAFVAHAIERGWSEENAKLWAWDYADKALMCRGDLTPEQMARLDVVKIEEDDSNA